MKQYFEKLIFVHQHFLSLQLNNEMHIDDIDISYTDFMFILFICDDILYINPHHLNDSFM